MTNSARKILSGLEPFVVVNRVRTENDKKAGEVIQNLLQQYLNIKSAIIMTIREDRAVGRAIARMTPVMSEAPDSPFSQDIKEIAVKLCE